MAKGTLSCGQQLHCIETVFKILSGQGQFLNIDPLRFYTHLYRNILYVHVGMIKFILLFEKPKYVYFDFFL